MAKFASGLIFIVNAIHLFEGYVFQKLKPFIVINIFMMLSISSVSQIIHVDADGPNDPGTGSEEDPFRRIQDAVDTAVHGDTIEIHPGLYVGIGNYDIDPGGKSITIGSREPDTAAITIIDPQQAGQGFLFQSGEDPNCILSGLTIRSGYSIEGSGGGISCYYSSPLIMNCIIEDNIADLYGGGIYSYASSPRLVECIIRSNQAIDGGGMECSGGMPEFDHCIIVNNQAAGLGGGCNFFYQSDSILSHCVIAKNTSSDGGGICCIDSQVIVKNSIVWENRAIRGAQMAIQSLQSHSSASVNYSDFLGGQTAVYDPNSNLVWASGNITSDPCFVSFNPAEDAEMWDFHLQSAYGRWNHKSRIWIADPNTSPCIDRGDPQADWSLEPWPNGKRINMGAYGGTIRASKNGNIADFNIDGMVDLEDLAQLTERWLTGQSCIEDLNTDSDVDIIDLSLFAEHWLWGRP